MFDSWLISGRVDRGCRSVGSADLMLCGLVPAAAALAASTLWCSFLEVHAASGSSTDACSSLRLVLRQLLGCFGSGEPLINFCTTIFMIDFSANFFLNYYLEFVRGNHIFPSKIIVVKTIQIYLNSPLTLFVFCCLFEKANQINDKCSLFLKSVFININISGHPKNPEESCFIP